MGGAIKLIQDKKPDAFSFLSEVWIAGLPKGAKLEGLKRGMASQDPAKVEGLVVMACKNGDKAHKVMGFTIDRVNGKLDRRPEYDAGIKSTRLPLSW